MQRAETMLASQPASLPPLIGAAHGFRAWINAGETRPAMRAAMIRYWRKRHLLRVPVPLTGVAALRSEQSWEWDLWGPAFLSAIETESVDTLDLLYALERTWFSARRATADRRKDAHDARAVDVLAAAPVLSATTLARVLGIAVKNAIRILDTLVSAEVAIEVTHRSKRRLFALSGLVPIRDAVRPPYRAEPGRGRGRPRHEIEQAVTDTAPFPLPPLTPIERRSFDYTALEEAMSQMDTVVRRTRHALTPRGPMMLEAPVERPDEPSGAGEAFLEETSGRRAESEESRFAAE